MLNSAREKHVVARIVSASNAAVPLLISVVYPPASFPGFSPRQFIYSDGQLLPLIVAPWSPPSTFWAQLSRAIQAVLLWKLPWPAVLHCYPLWVCIALLRTVLGHILTRSVGWAYSRFFRHWALYEEAGGFGPALVAYLYVFSTVELPIVRAAFARKRTHVEEWPMLVGLGCLLCWLDQAPWTYGVAVAGAALCAMAQWLLRKRIMSFHTTLPDSQKTTITSGQSTKLRTIISSAILTLTVLSLSYTLLNQLIVPPDVALPASPSDSRPLLEILMLSFPRPDEELSTKIMTQSIASYAPHLGSDIRMSVFTHAVIHPAFAANRELFETQYNITFYTDADVHPDAEIGQHLHLAEAFRWVEQRQTPEKAEWVMLVEDDFALCGEERGWRAVKRVMSELEESRVSTEMPKRRGGFVGTGGSGLVIHQTLLSTLVLLLRTYADSPSKLSPLATRRPPDVVVQDCLLGLDPLCPQVSAGEHVVITSRLVLDHLGGMVTTNKGKAPNSDKWRCGWRHPFHGRPRIDVVEV